MSAISISSGLHNPQWCRLMSGEHDLEIGLQVCLKEYRLMDMPVELLSFDCDFGQMEITLQ